MRWLATQHTAVPCLGPCSSLLPAGPGLGHRGTYSHGYPSCRLARAVHGLQGKRQGDGCPAPSCRHQVDMQVFYRDSRVESVQHRQEVPQSPRDPRPSLALWPLPATILTQNAGPWLVLASSRGSWLRVMTLIPSTATWRTTSMVEMGQPRGRLRKLAPGAEGREEFTS